MKNLKMVSSFLSMMMLLTQVSYASEPDKAEDREATVPPVPALHQMAYNCVLTSLGFPEGPGFAEIAQMPPKFKHLQEKLSKDVNEKALTSMTITSFFDQSIDNQSVYSLCEKMWGSKTFHLNNFFLLGMVAYDHNMINNHEFSCPQYISKVFSFLKKIPFSSVCIGSEMLEDFQQIDLAGNRLFQTVSKQKILSGISPTLKSFDQWQEILSDISPDAASLFSLQEVRDLFSEQFTRILNQTARALSQDSSSLGPQAPMEVVLRFAPHQYLLYLEKLSQQSEVESVQNKLAILKVAAWDLTKTMRYTTLRPLQGEFLNTSMTALSANLYLKELSFHNYNSKDTSLFGHLAYGLENAIPLETLNLSSAFNLSGESRQKIDENIWHFSQSLENNKTLTSLSIAGSALGNNIMAVLFQGIVHHPKLTSLDISNCSIDSNPSFQGTGIEALANFIRYNTTLKTLALEDNTLHNSGGLGIGQLVEPLKVNTTLTSLNLCNTVDNPGGIANILKGVEGNTTLTFLDLSKNYISNADSSLVPSLQKNNPNLHVKMDGMRHPGSDSEDDDNNGGCILS